MISPYPGPRCELEMDLESTEELEVTVCLGLITFCIRLSPKPLLTLILWHVLPAEKPPEGYASHGSCHATHKSVVER